MKTAIEVLEAVFAMLMGAAAGALVVTEDRHKMYACACVIVGLGITLALAVH